MRWKKHKIQRGDRRIKRFFAFFPITVYNYIDGRHETRWLEFIRLEQICESVDWEGPYWQNYKFLK